MEPEKKGTSKRDIDITYRLPFRRKEVFSAWVDPEYLKQWFAPRGCTIRFEKLELYEGGSFHSCIDNPVFGECWCIGTYLEIKSPERIVFTMINADKDGNPVEPASIGMDPKWPGKTTVTVTFREENRETIVSLKQTADEELAKKTGAYPSWLEMLEKMRSLVGSL